MQRALRSIYEESQQISRKELPEYTKLQNLLP